MNSDSHQPVASPRPPAPLGLDSASPPPQPPPLADPSGTSGIPPRADPQTLADLRAEATFRKWLSLVATILGLAAMGGTIVYGLENPCVKLPAETPTAVAIIVFVERGLLSVAGVLFGYSMLRVAERMLVPWHLTKDSSHVELVRILIGEDSPARAVVRAAKESAAIAGGLVRDAAALVHGEKSERKD